MDAKADAEDKWETDTLSGLRRNRVTGEYDDSNFCHVCGAPAWSNHGAIG